MVRETLLLKALAAGWGGTISGASNVLASWMVQIYREWSTDRESAETKFSLVLPLIRAIKQYPQPAGNKAVLAAQGILDRADPRLPLLPTSAQDTAKLVAEIESILGPIRAACC